MDINLEKVKDKVVPFILEAGDHAYLQWENLEVNYHENGLDVTTNVDRSIEQSFHNFIKSSFPNHGFHGEELPEYDEKHRYIWHIDPIDGTKYYAKQGPLWTVDVSLYYNNHPRLGLIYNPVSKQLLYAIKDKGAFLNNKPLCIGKKYQLDKAMVCVESGIDLYMYKEKKEKIDKVLSNLLSAVYRMRMLGSSSVGLCWLSQGIFDAYIFPFCGDKGKLDIAAGKIIAKEAGATIYQMKREDYPEYDIFIAGNKEIVEQLIPLVVF